jgi:hypothetical protein
MPYSWKPNYAPNSGFLLYTFRHENNEGILIFTAYNHKPIHGPRLICNSKSEYDTDPLFRSPVIKHA